jgi:glyoxylase-like metal-dependent hydrolase (beta-lactamase superfamily II)
MHELRPGLWHWQAPHPEWTPDEPWPQIVSSYAVHDGSRLLLFDPLEVPEPLLELAAERQPVIVLTAPWHERDAKLLVERLDSPVHTPRRDTAEDLMRKFGITREQAGDGSPDLRWLLTEGGGDPHLYEAGDRLPFGIEAFEGRESNDLVLWIERFRAVLTGDTLVDYGQGFEINRWLRDGVTRAEVIERLRPLLALPVELVLPAHGVPRDRAELDRALA